MSYIFLTKKKKNKQTDKQKSKTKKARSERCVISRAEIDDRFTARWLDRSSSDNEESGRHDSARRLKNALILSSSFGRDLQEE